MSKHTPGPWSVDGVWRTGGLAIGATDTADGQLFQVCEVFGIDHETHHDERSHANANLIAAAPDLLAALKAVRTQYIDDHSIAIPEEQHTDQLLVQIDAAIAKAEGVDSAQGKTAEESEWIEWNGGNCPVDEEAFVDLRFRIGEENNERSIPAGVWNWKQLGSMYDIVAYRVAIGGAA